MQLPWYLSSHSTYIAPSRCTFRALLFPRLDQRKEITLLYEELEQWWSLATFRVRGTRMEPWVSARNKPASNHFHFSHTGFRVNGKKKASASKSSVSVFKLNLWPRHFSRFREILSLESGETPPLSSGNNEGHLDTFSTLYAYVTIALGRPIWSEIHPLCRRKCSSRSIREIFITRPDNGRHGKIFLLTFISVLLKWKINV